MRQTPVIILAYNYFRENHPIRMMSGQKFEGCIIKTTIEYEKQTVCITQLGEPSKKRTFLADMYAKGGDPCPLSKCKFLWNLKRRK